MLGSMANAIRQGYAQGYDARSWHTRWQRGTILKREILEKCPDISVVTVSVVLKHLCDEGFICKTGNGRNAADVRIE